MANEDENPTDIILSNSRFSENVPSGSSIATLYSVDPDEEESFSYDLVTGDGGEDNSAFTIDGDQLIINESPNFEQKSTYNIRLRTKDLSGLS